MHRFSGTSLVLEENCYFFLIIKNYVLSRSVTSNLDWYHVTYARKNIGPSLIIYTYYDVFNNSYRLKSRSAK